MQTKYKMRYSLEPRYRKYVQGQGFISFLKILEINMVIIKVWIKVWMLVKNMVKNMVTNY